MRMMRVVATLLVALGLFASSAHAQTATATVTPTPTVTPTATATVSATPTSTPGPQSPATDAAKCVPFIRTATGGSGWLRQNPGYSRYSLSLDKTAGSGTIILEGSNGAGASATLKSCTDDCADGTLDGPFQYMQVRVTACSGCRFAGAYCGAAP